MRLIIVFIIIILITLLLYICTKSIIETIKISGITLIISSLLSLIIVTFIKNITINKVKVINIKKLIVPLSREFYVNSLIILSIGIMIYVICIIYERYHKIYDNKFVIANRK